MSSDLLVNILIVYIVFKLGANFDMALYVNMFISAVQCVVNVNYAKTTFNYPVRTFISSILVPCVFCVTIVVAVMLGFISYFESTIVRFFASVAISESVIMLSGYFIVLNQTEKEMVRAIVRKVFHRKS